MDVEERIMKTSETVFHDAPTPPPSTILSERTENSVPLCGNADPTEDEKGMYSCDKCQYKAKQRSNLMRHYYTMHADLADSLECCGQFYRTKGDFRQHVKTVHKQGYLCKICNRTFSRKALLKRHSYVHNGIREFKCEHCNYATSHKSNLERHFKVHTPLLRKRRCRLSYRISSTYPKHVTVDTRHVQSEPAAVDDKLCRSFLGRGLSAASCQIYGLGPLSGSGGAWGKYPIARDDALHPGPFSTRSTLEEYESILKSQLLNRKHLDIRRSPSLHSDELSMLPNLATRLSKHPAAFTPHTPPAMPDPLQTRLGPKDPPVFSTCDPNCFCTSKAMWMLPIYQGFLSHHDLYSQLVNKHCGSMHSSSRPELVQRPIFDDLSSLPRINTDSAFHGNNRSIYLDLLKMQENVLAKEHTKARESMASKRNLQEIPVAHKRETEVIKSFRKSDAIRPSSESSVPQSDQPLKKRYKRFFIDNLS
ncbi:B-cell lymphoma 6 protein-like [Holothuria leucospilota]|uniref:B-cell lymphoma 6 protein-like n=1 Tax=Holothuria leucospilota TaxID=206669 RepID=A0A9Q1BPZ6_HOLLE|nr:B-cell lymphoma 6 protein-like [Holothuria leucospilota]